MEETTTTDVAVIGGGPSGLRTAGRLAESGLEVLVIERKPRIGQDVVCTGIVGRQIFDDFGLSRGAVLRDLQAAELVSPGGLRVHYRHPSVFARVVDRGEFDRELAARAEAAGAAFRLGTKVNDIAVGRESVRIDARDAAGAPVRLFARLAVIATGIDGTLQKRLGLGQPADILIGAQAEVDSDAIDITRIFVGRDVAPGAFAWAVPAEPGRARIGLLTQGGEARSRLAALLESLGIPAAGLPSGAIRIKPVAHGLTRGTTADRVLVVGEAAGQIKTTTGGGIAYGLRCADIAADAIQACAARNDFSAAALAAYDGAWRKALRKEILIGYHTRRTCARLSDGQLNALFRLAQTDGILPLVREKGDFDRHGELILALLKRLSFMDVFRELAESLRPQSAS